MNPFTFIFCNSPGVVPDVRFSWMSPIGRTLENLAIRDPGCMFSWIPAGVYPRLRSGAGITRWAVTLFFLLCLGEASGAGREETCFIEVPKSLVMSYSSCLHRIPVEPPKLPTSGAHRTATEAPKASSGARRTVAEGPKASSGTPYSSCVHQHVHELVDLAREEKRLLKDIRTESLRLSLRLSQLLEEREALSAATDTNFSLLELVNRRLSSEIVISSLFLVFSGNGQLYSFDGSLSIEGGQRPFDFFAPHQLDEEVQRLTAYERVEMILDTVFGLKSGEQGVPPPSERNDSLSSLLNYKFDFVLGAQRDGNGRRYGHTHTKNHFSDDSRCQGTFPGLRGGQGIVLAQSPPQTVTGFFDSYGVQTDLERLKILLDVLITIKKT